MCIYTYLTYYSNCKRSSVFFVTDAATRESIAVSPRLVFFKYIYIYVCVYTRVRDYGRGGDDIFGALISGYIRVASPITKYLL